MNNRFLTRDFWQERDKQIHAVLMFIITSMITVVIGVVFGGFIGMVSGIAVAVVIGWLKEVHDGFGNGVKDIDDIDADMVGTLSGSLVSGIMLLL